MPPIVSTALFAAAAAGAMYAMVRWLGDCASRSAAASAQYDHFYRHAQRLIRDERTPDSVLAFIGGYAAEAGRPRLARSLLFDFLIGREPPKTLPETKRFALDVEKMPAELRDEFSRMIACGYISGAISDPILGRIHRRVFPLLMSTSGRKDSPPSMERAVTVASDFAIRHPQDREPVAA